MFNFVGEYHSQVSETPAESGPGAGGGPLRIFMFPISGPIHTPLHAVHRPLPGDSDICPG